MSEKERQSMIADGSLISIFQAAKQTPYSAEYLSLLARKGRLKAVKISRDWLITFSFKCFWKTKLSNKIVSGI